MDRWNLKITIDPVVAGFGCLLAGLGALALAGALVLLKSAGIL